MSNKDLNFHPQIFCLTRRVGKCDEECCGPTESRCTSLKLSPTALLTTDYGRAKRLVLHPPKAHALFRDPFTLTYIEMKMLYQRLCEVCFTLFGQAVHYVQQKQESATASDPRYLSLYYDATCVIPNLGAHFTFSDM